MLHIFHNRITIFIKSKIIHPLLFNRTTKIFNYWMRLLFKKESKFVTLDHFIANHPNNAAIITSNREETFCCAEQTSFNYAHIAQKGRTVDCFVALLKNASCFAFSDLIILSDGSYYCEIKTDPILGKSSDCNDGFILRRDGKYSHYTDIPKKAVRLSSGILLSGLFSWNYYHYTFQIIPKVQWISMIPPSVPLLVDDKVEDIPSFAELLKICNKQNRPIFVMETKVRYIVDELYYISTQTFLEPNHKKGTRYPEVRCFYKPSTLEFLRQTIIPVASEIREKFPNRIYLGRKYASSRRKFNEDECIDCAKEFGFEVVYPELLSLQQQVALFNNAEMIVGGSGAAFTNLVYCKEGVFVLVLAKFYPNLGLWQSIVDYLHGKLAYVLETDSINDIPSDPHVPFTIDISRLKKSLQYLVQEKALLAPKN